MQFQDSVNTAAARYIKLSVGKLKSEIVSSMSEEMIPRLPKRLRKIDIESELSLPPTSGIQVIEDNVNPAWIVWVKQIRFNRKEDEVGRKVSLDFGITVWNNRTLGFAGEKTVNVVLDSMAYNDFADAAAEKITGEILRFLPSSIDLNDYIVKSVYDSLRERWYAVHRFGMSGGLKGFSGKIGSNGRSLGFSYKYISIFGFAWGISGSLGTIDGHEKSLVIRGGLEDPDAEMVRTRMAGILLAYHIPWSKFTETYIQFDLQTRRLSSFSDFTDTRVKTHYSASLGYGFTLGGSFVIPDQGCGVSIGIGTMLQKVKSTNFDVQGADPSKRNFDIEIRKSPLSTLSLDVAVYYDLKLKIDYSRILGK